jgi:hypothetical protein
MSKRPIKTPGSEALLEARKAFREEYPHAKEWQVKRLALLSVSRDRYEAMVAAGADIDLGALLRIDEALETSRSAIALAEPVNISVRFVEGYHGIANIVCPYCKKASRHEISDKPFDAAPTSSEISTRVDTAPTSPENGSQTPSTDAPAPAESDSNTHSNPPPANVVPLTVAAHREGVSASPFHNALLSNGESAPLKYRQPSHYHTADHDPHPYYNADGTPRVLAHKLPT